MLFEQTDLCTISYTVLLPFELLFEFIIFYSLALYFEFFYKIFKSNKSTCIACRVILEFREYHVPGIDYGYLWCRVLSVNPVYA